MNDAIFLFDGKTGKMKDMHEGAGADSACGGSPRASWSAVPPFFFTGGRHVCFDPGADGAGSVVAFQFHRRASRSTALAACREGRRAIQPGLESDERAFDRIFQLRVVGDFPGLDHGIGRARVPQGAL